MFDIQTRRQFLNATGMGLGASVLGNLTAQGATGTHGYHLPKAKAKRVIFLFMAGAPSQLDLFDYKPDLHKRFKEALPDSVTNGQRVTAMTKGKEKLVAPSMFKFKQHGQGGTHLSELLPHLGSVADDIALIKSTSTTAINHDPGKTLFCTGTEIPGKASIGAWLSYGLGRMNQNLRDFIVLNSAYWTGGKGNVQGLYSRLWGSGFLPSKHQGVSFQPSGDPVLFLSNPKSVTRESRHKMLDLVTKLNEEHIAKVGDPEIQTTIAQQEMAFRMQASVPELTDLSGESKKTLEMYGATPGDGSYASNCLLARRLVEKGTRFVQLYHRGWDHHGDLDKYMKVCCKHTDQATYALLTDLKQRGLLQDTLVVWGGEFGRTPMFQVKGGPGRDHHIKGFSMWMAGGGVKPGLSYGATDELGYKAQKDVVHVRDFHATLLHLLGIDHHRFSKKFQGLDMRLTGVEPAKVVKGILS